MQQLYYSVLLMLVLVLLVPFVVLYLPLLALGSLLWGSLLRIWFWRVHRVHGRFILFVYSESPNWQAYLEQHVLPHIRSHSVVLNWSRRRAWPRECPGEARVFRHWAGRRNFNPMALVFLGRWRVVSIRFYQAFLDSKHGQPSALRQAEADLLAYVQPAGTAAA